MPTNQPTNQPHPLPPKPTQPKKTPYSIKPRVTTYPTSPISSINPIQSNHPIPPRSSPPSSLKPEIGNPPTAKFQRSSRNIPIRQLRYLPTTITSQIRLVRYFGGFGPILQSNIGIVPSVRRISWHARQTSDVRMRGGRGDFRVRWMGGVHFIFDSYSIVHVVINLHDGCG